MLKPILAALAVASFATLGACTQETRVEDQSAADQIEDAARDAGNEIEQAGDNAADAIQDAGNNAEDAVNDATDGNPNTNP